MVWGGNGRRGLSQMTKHEIIKNAEKFVEESPGNYISAEAAISAEYLGMKIYDSPIFAFGCANDELYEKYKSPDVIGSHFLAPLEWLPNAKTVISFFLPYTERINAANGRDYSWPADEWLHGRYEGQIFLTSLSMHIQQLLTKEGYDSLAPSFDPQYGNAGGDSKFTSNWSERHVAFACGLGTFGLSKGIITKKGTSGRFGSILTALDLPKDNRTYTDVYEYCTMCGACVPHCPVQAISLADGKKSLLCSGFLDKVREKCSPRYGCGKCQVNVPCESGIPAAKSAN